MRDLNAIEAYMRAAMLGFDLSAFLFYVLVLFTIGATILGALGFVFLFQSMGQSLKKTQQEQEVEAEPISTPRAS